MLLSSLKAFVDLNKSKGRGEAFGFDAVTTEVYLKWAFSHDYLFVSMNGNQIDGIGIVYPIRYKNTEDSMFSFSEKISKQDEHLHDLCVMDMISLNKESTKNLVNDFKTRYPHWSSCKKWALRFGNIKEITNKYINLL